VGNSITRGKINDKATPAIRLLGSLSSCAYKRKIAAKNLSLCPNLLDHYTPLSTQSNRLAGTRILARYVIPNRLMTNTPMELLYIQSERAMTLTEIAIDPAITDLISICSRDNKSIWDDLKGRFERKAACRKTVVFRY
jgi:hypothetical protein